MARLLPNSKVLRCGPGAVIALGLALLQGCGGGGSSSGGGTPTPLTTLAGAWKATGSDGSREYALIVPNLDGSGNPTGDFSYRAIQTDQAFLGAGKVSQVFGGDLTLNGTTVASAPSTLLFPLGALGPGLPPAISGSLAGTADSRGMPLTFTPDTVGPNTPVIRNTYIQDSATQLQVSPLVLAGQYTATPGNTSLGVSATINMTVAANGSLQFADTSTPPALTGTATQIGSSNAFHVQAAFQGDSTYSGLAYAVPGSLANTYNIVVMTSNLPTGGNPTASLAGIFNFAGPAPLATLAGIYGSSAADSGTNYMLVTGPDGGPYDFRLMNVNGALPTTGKAVQLAGAMTLSGTTVNGSTSILVPQGFPVAFPRPATVTGSANTFGISFAVTGLSQDQLTLNPATFLVLDPASLVGSYTSTAANNSVGVPFNIEMTAASATSPVTVLDFTDGQIPPRLSGTATQATPGSNVFTVNATYATPTPASFTGLAYALPVAGTARYTFVLMLDDNHGAPGSYSLAGLFD